MIPFKKATWFWTDIVRRKNMDGKPPVKSLFFTHMNSIVQVFSGLFDIGSKLNKTNLNG